MINTRIALSMATIGAAGILTVGATFAFFSDSNTSTNNSFSSGTVKLALCDTKATGGGTPEPCPSPGTSQSVTGSFGGSNMAPNNCLDPQTLTVQNTGTIGGNHIDITATNDNAAFAKFLRLAVFTYNPGGGPVDLVIADSNGNGFRDLQDLETFGVINQPETDFFTHDIIAQVCLDSSATNDQAGQTNNLNLTVKLDQGIHI